MKVEPLIFSASIGQGHNQAAKALSLELYDKGFQPEVIDTFYALNPLLHKCLLNSYLSLLKMSPAFWRHLYYHAEHHPFFTCMDHLGTLFLERIHRFIKGRHVPFILSTHPFVTPFLAKIKKKHRLSIPIYSVITDFVMHPAYLRENIDHYFTADPNSFRLAQKWKYPSNRFSISGIPVLANDTYHQSKWKLRYDLGLEQEKKTVLIAGGGIGLTNYEEVIKGLECSERELTILCMTGHNYKATSKLKSLETRHNMKVIPFTNRFLDYLKASDVIVSKSGGLTMAEALICETPIIIYKPVPGHEEHNAEFLQDKGAAVIVQEQNALTLTMRKILYHRKVNERMKLAARELKKPNATSEIVNTILRKEAGQEIIAKQM